MSSTKTKKKTPTTSPTAKKKTRTTTSHDQRLAELGIKLPALAAPVGAYVPAVHTGEMIYTSGQLPMVDGTLLAKGKVPTDVPLELAQKCARQAALNALAAIRSVTGTLDVVKRIVRLNVFVNSGSGFVDQAKVANGASELLGEVFGPAGQHTRCAVGVAELPLNAPVELDVVVQVGR
jgi:enamine deaminase RidA (YjgF/YER057c/UK114 family)